MAPPTPLENYEQRASLFGEKARASASQAKTLATLRICLFSVFLILSILGTSHYHSVIATGASTSLILFLLAVLYDRKVKREQRIYDIRSTINERGISRITRRWEALPEVSVGGGDRKAADLGITGHGSLLHLIGHTGSSDGNELLYRWLIEGSGKPAAEEQHEIEKRQAAVEELAPAFELREELQLLRWRKEIKRSSHEVPSSHFMSAQRALMLAVLLPLTNISVLIALLLLELPLPWVVVTLVATLLLSFRLTKGDHDLYNLLSVRADTAEPLIGVVRALGALTPQSLLLQTIVNELKDAERGLNSLILANSFSSMRRSSVFAFLQIAFLWNLTSLALALRWRERWEAYFLRWKDALAQFDALMALALLRYENTDWCMPTITASKAPSITAHTMGHPLIRGDECVRNSITIADDTRFIILTGSNMSGKSTLLRAIGINSALALAGGPVSAGHFEITPLVISTSMRVSDSLTKGRSLYLAELLQIREVIRQAEGADRAVLFLLDEILHGTNSYERALAVRKVVARLLDLGAIGCVTTHDLSLAEVDRSWAPTPYYFSDEIHEGEEGPVMTFDYLLKPGVAPRTNGLALLEAIGVTTTPET